MTVALLPAHASAMQSSLDLVVPAFDLAEKIARTDFVPAALRGKPEAVLAAILTGHELGIGPMQSLAKIHVIEGKPSMAAELMRALVLAAGHDIWVVDSNSTRCVVGAKRSGSERESTFTWTLDDAKKAGIEGKQNWRKYPRAMLLARATSEAIRAVFPDVVAGVSYSTEELTDGEYFDLEDGAPAASGVAPPRRARARKAAAASASPIPAAGPTATAERPLLPGEDEVAEMSGGDTTVIPPDDGEMAGEPASASPGPPAPPDEGPSLPLASRIAMWCSDAGIATDIERHAFLCAFSEGRYRSAKEVPSGDVLRLRSTLAHIKRGELALQMPDRPDGMPTLIETPASPSTAAPTSDEREPELLPDYKTMRVGALAAACRERGLDDGGTKAELIGRLETVTA